MAAPPPELVALLGEAGYTPPQWKFRMNKIDSCSDKDADDAPPPPEVQAALAQAAAAGGAPAGAATYEDGAEAGAMVESNDDDGAIEKAEPRNEGIKVPEGNLPTQHTVHEMVMVNRIDKVAKQLDKGVPVNIPDCFGETPLFWCNSAEMVDYLVQEGADIEWRNSLCNCSAFYKFACGGKHKPLKALAKWLKRGDKLEEYVYEVSSHTQRTALHAAAANGYTDVVRELLAMGADKKKQDYVGKTPIDLAKARADNEELLALLE